MLHLVRPYLLYLASSVRSGQGCAGRLAPSQAFSTAIDGTDAGSASSQAPSALSAGAAVLEATASTSAITSGRPRMLGRRSTRSGYRESFILPDLTESTGQPSSSAGPAAAEHGAAQAVLRVHLRQNDQLPPSGADQTAGSVPQAVDAAVEAASSAAAAEAKLEAQLVAGIIPLDKEATYVFKTFVGALTKEGDKSRAQRIVRDAMDILQHQLNKIQGLQLGQDVRAVMLNRKDQRLNGSEQPKL